MTILLTKNKLKKYWNQIKSLLLYCKMSSSGEIMPDDFYEKKLSDLIQYLDQNKAYFFVELENEVVQGFLWACEIKKNISLRFHVLYFAVLPECQKRGIGSRLLAAAEQQAKKMGIQEIELNVYRKNSSAMNFYIKHEYIEERITMKKSLM